MKTSQAIRIAGILLVLALAAGCGAMSSAATGGGSTGHGGTVVSTAHSSALGATVLVNSSGRTLYSLSAEQHGKFICTKGSHIPGSSASCLSLWTPLIEQGGVSGQGVGSLGTVRRPGRSRRLARSRVSTARGTTPTIQVCVTPSCR